MAELDRFMAAIRQVESGGNYRAIGPKTKYGNATGAYQFLDSTWGGYGGYRQAKDAPQSLQDARAAELMTAYYRQFGSWDLVAVAWHGGPGAANKARASGKIGGYDAAAGISTDSYTKRVMSNMGSTVGRSTKNPSTVLTGTGGRPQQTSAQLVSQIGKEIERAFNVRITSRERSAARNSSVGGAKNSDHLWGGALDLAGSKEDLDRLAAWAKDNPLFRWVGWQVAGHYDHAHLSFNKQITIPPDLFGSTAALSSYQSTRPKFALTMQGVSNIFGGQSPLNQPPVSLTGSWSQPQNQTSYQGTGDLQFANLPYQFSEWGAQTTAAPASAKIAGTTTPRPTPRPTSPTKVIGAVSGKTVTF